MQGDVFLFSFREKRSGLSEKVAHTEATPHRPRGSDSSRRLRNSNGDRN